jgi:hypothetical protein
MISRELHPKSKVPLQVLDFSSVVWIFHLISRVFIPVLSQKALISSWLQRKHGLNDSRKATEKTVLPESGGSSRQATAHATQDAKASEMKPHPKIRIRGEEKIR